MELLLKFNFEKFTKMLIDEGFEEFNTIGSSQFKYIKDRCACIITQESQIYGSIPLSTTVKFYNKFNMLNDYNNYPASLSYIMGELAVERHYENDRLKNLNGPVIVKWNNGEKECEHYKLYGEYTRFDGPAYIDYFLNNEEYYLFNKQLSKKTYWTIINGINNNKLNLSRYSKANREIIKKTAEHLKNNYMIELINSLDLVDKLIEG